MKKLFLFFVISLCLSNFVYAQTWHQAFNVPIPVTRGGCMVDQNTAWFVGDYQSLIKSTDGGMTWVTKFQSDTSIYHANDIYFVNSTTGFVGCSRGQILKTTDGGESWSKLTNPGTVDSIVKVHFFDANLGFALADSGTSSSSNKSIIYKTTDGGTTWTITATITGCYMYNMDFSSTTTGIAIGNTGYLYYTTDGATWNKAPNPTLPSSIIYSRTDQWGLKFISPTSAVSCGWGSTAVGFQPTIFLKTTNAGATWTYLNQENQNLAYVNFYSLYFKDSLNGISTGGATYPGTVICRTTDGGTNWVPLPSVSGFSPSVVIGFNNKVIISGGSGEIILSSDFGDSWITVNQHPRSTLSSINIINNHIYSCGYDGTFFKSSDLGITFNMSYMVSANKCLWSKGIYFLNENLGYAASQKGQALKTTDAGNSWTQILRDSSSNTINNQGLYFINENIGFVVGNIASNVDIIYKTTNGGGSWSSVQNIAFQNLNCVAFADSVHGAAGGNKSAILFTTDQGVSWKTATVNTTDQLAINAINFYNGLNGLAVGSSIILKTTDGGATWNRITVSTSANLSSICYSGSTFYTVGSKYCFKSTDDGNTWQNIMDTVFAVNNYSTILNSVAIDNSGFLWIAGSGGLLTNTPLTGIKKDAVQPGSFNLGQNYPNPFNPSTNISFTIIQHGFVTLKLFDILGREVRVIYKGEMAAGMHTINFNAGNLASGNYIYSLQVNDQFTCRKMTLLK